MLNQFFAHDGFQGAAYVTPNEKIKDVAQKEALHEALTVPGVASTPGDRRLDPRRGEVALHLRDHLGEVAVTRGCPLGDEPHDLVVHLGVQGPEREVLELHLMVFMPSRCASGA